MRRPHTLLVLAVLTIAACDAQEPTPPAVPPGGDAAIVTSTAAPPPPPDLSTWTPEPAPSGQTGTPRGLDLDPADVDETDPFQVANAFAMTMLTPDALIDRSPADVSRRAAAWADQPYAEALRADRPAGGGAQWVALGQRQGYLSVQLQTHPAVEDGLVAPEPEQLTVDVPILAIVTAHDADLPEQHIAALVSLHRTSPDAPWRVYEWTQEDYR